MLFEQLKANRVLPVHVCAFEWQVWRDRDGREPPNFATGPGSQLASGTFRAAFEQMHLEDVVFKGGKVCGKQLAQRSIPSHGVIRRLSPLNLPQILQPQCRELFFNASITF